MIDDDVRRTSIMFGQGRSKFAVDVGKNDDRANRHGFFWKLQLDC